MVQNVSAQRSISRLSSSFVQLIKFHRFKKELTWCCSTNTMDPKCIRWLRAVGDASSGQSVRWLLPGRSVIPKSRMTLFMEKYRAQQLKTHNYGNDSYFLGHQRSRNDTKKIAWGMAEAIARLFMNLWWPHCCWKCVWSLDYDQLVFALTQTTDAQRQQFPQHFVEQCGWLTRSMVFNCVLFKFTEQTWLKKCWKLVDFIIQFCRRGGGVFSLWFVKLQCEEKWKNKHLRWNYENEQQKGGPEERERGSTK